MQTLLKEDLVERVLVKLGQMIEELSGSNVHFESHEILFRKSQCVQLLMSILKFISYGLGKPLNL